MAQAQQIHLGTQCNSGGCNTRWRRKIILATTGGAAVPPPSDSSLPSARISPYSFAVLRSLRLMDFRCFASLDLEVPAEGAILTGDNAQGKTSILEALCMLVRLHSPRTHRMTALGRFGGKGFGIAGDPWGSELQVRYSREGLVLKIDE